MDCLWPACDLSYFAFTLKITVYFFCNRCRPADGKKQCLPSWFGNECRTHCIPRDDDGGHYICAHDGSITCIPGWHGDNCTVFCVPQDDDELGHYACDNDGNKVCLEGFHGFTANCSLTCLPENETAVEEVQYKCADNGEKVCNPWWYGPECSEYCVPHNDTVHGHYTCDPRDGRKVCLKGWEGRECRRPRRDWVIKVEWRWPSLIMSSVTAILNYHWIELVEISKFL